MAILYTIACCAAVGCLGYAALAVYLRLTRRYCTSDADLTGKVVVITGANTGIGFETAVDLARRNARVILACRSQERGERAAERIRAQTGNRSVVCKICDVSSMQSVREFADEFLREETRLDILINNAGVSGVPLTMTEEGLELTWASNYLGHFLLTHVLLDVLKRSTPSRVVNVSSTVHAQQAKINFDDLFSTKRYFPNLVYRDTKLAQVLFSKELASRLEGTGVTTVSLHPGVVQTEVMRHNPVIGKIFAILANIGLLKTPREGAQSTIHCAVSPEVARHSGCYYDNCRLAKETQSVHDSDLRKRLWEVSEHLVGLN